MRALNRLARRGPGLHLGLGLAMVVALGAGARAEDSPGPAPAASDSLEKALEPAIAAIAAAVEREVAAAEGFEIAVVPIVGADGTDLATHVTESVTRRLERTHARVLDRSWMDELAKAARRAPAGSSQRLTSEQLAFSLGCQATCTGTLVEVDGRYVLTLRLLAAETGRELANATAKIEKAGAADLKPLVAASGGARIRAPSLGAVSAEEKLVIDRAIVIQRRAADGTFGEPEVWNDAERPPAIGDRIQMWIRPHQDCHLTVIASETSGAVTKLFPEEGTPTAVTGGADVTLPKPVTETADQWYPIAGPPGTDRFYIIVESKNAAKKAGSLTQVESPVIEVAQPASVPEAKPADLAPAAAPPSPAPEPPTPPPPAAPPTKDPAPAPPAADPPKQAAKAQPSAKVVQFRQNLFHERAQAAGLDARFDQNTLERRAREMEQLLSSGVPVDNARLRALGKPVAGDEVKLTWQGVGKALVLPRRKGVGQIIERFEITYK